MASVLRTGLANFNPSGLLGGLCKLAPRHRNAVVTQVSFISSREQRKGRPPRPPPFDWRHKGYNRWQYLFDPMEERFDDNSKIIIVEGMPGVGKDKFAKQLAEELEMTYMPPANFDKIWTNPYGFDHRTLNSKLPIDAQFYDIKSFLDDPKGRNTAAMQTTMYLIKYDQYIDALLEVLSTGNGVVLQRSPYSDVNFMEAIYKNGYASRGALSYYKAAVKSSLPELMYPHLIIYLDAPISVVKDNIKKRNIPYEVNSPALTDQYLNDLDTITKEYLRDATRHSHLLVYDWSKEGDVRMVAEGIEALDFDSFKGDDEKFFDWRYEHIYELKMRRGDYDNYRDGYMISIAVARFDVPEMIRSAADSKTLEEVLETVPQAKYAPGFNPLYDKGVLWKLHDKFEDWLPRRLERKQE